MTIDRARLEAKHRRFAAETNKLLTEQLERRDAADDHHDEIAAMIALAA